MDCNPLEFKGDWDDSLVLDKHVLHSECIGEYPDGRPQFDTTRTEVGEAIFQLKYRDNDEFVEELADTMAGQISEFFGDVDAIVPMPASQTREVQPVSILANEVADILGVPCIENLLLKSPDAPQMKNLDKSERKEALLGNLMVMDVLDQNDEPLDIVLLDDLYSSGATMEAATQVLREYPRIDRIYIAAFSKTR
ncbi:ComF family protein [Vibrio parahaemolyticus]|nr:ComF family protein [Vibrio parahaemolyticus]MDF4716073.1 ComF family protein [Vibrio parahaemolyticus]